MVEVVGEGARRSRTYAITDGRPRGAAPLAARDRAVAPQRNETAVRWFLSRCWSPPTAGSCSSASSRTPRPVRRDAGERAAELDALERPHPFRPTVDLGLRTTAVMREWLREQIAATDG